MIKSYIVFLKILLFCLRLKSVVAVVECVTHLVPSVAVQVLQALRRASVHQRITGMAIERYFAGATIVIGDGHDEFGNPVMGRCHSCGSDLRTHWAAAFDALAGAAAGSGASMKMMSLGSI